VDVFQVLSFPEFTGKADFYEKLGLERISLKERKWD
jgi:hypothetical protein